MVMRRIGGGRVRLYSKKKGPGGKRRNLGTFRSVRAAKRRERQINYFKHRGRRR
jgi:hypothetical protein